MGFAAASLKKNAEANTCLNAGAWLPTTLCDDVALFFLSLFFLFLSIDKFPSILFSGLHELWHLQTVYYTLGQKTKYSHLSWSPIYYIYGTISINLSHPFSSHKSQNIINTVHLQCSVLKLKSNRNHYHCFVIQ